MIDPAVAPRPRLPHLLLVLALTAALASCASGDPELAETAPVSAPAPAAPTTDVVSAAVYTATQAERGAEVYGDVCADCHTRVEFKEDAFLFGWEGSSVGRLLSYLMESMPDDAPGTLPERSYLDVTAYILQMNGWSAGSQELRNDEALLSGLTFEAR
jgi:mono/diheme cytochrome c family protein